VEIRSGEYSLRMRPETELEMSKLDVFLRHNASAVYACQMGLSLVKYQNLKKCLCWPHFAVHSV